MTEDMKLISILLLSALLLVVTTILLTTNRPATDLEIYTVEDIYYIKGLSVTTESGSYQIRFDSESSLKQFMSNITAKTSVPSEIKLIESYNEMIPEEYIDDFKIILKTGNVIHEYKYDCESMVTEELNSYEYKAEEFYE